MIKYNIKILVLIDLYLVYYINKSESIHTYILFITVWHTENDFFHTNHIAKEMKL